MMEPATSIYPRYGLADALREALTISVSPNQNLAAVTDSLGRVVLIDLQRGIAVRMWKGITALRHKDSPQLHASF